jgi:chromosome segregation ATPase
MSKSIQNMINADSLVIPIAAFLIAGLLGALKLLGDKWIKTFENKFVLFEKNNDKILSALSDIKDQISDLKMENQMQSASLDGVVNRVETRFQGLERRLENKRQMIGALEEKVKSIEKDLLRMKSIHNHIHPNERIEG